MHCYLSPAASKPIKIFLLFYKHNNYHLEMFSYSLSALLLLWIHAFALGRSRAACSSQPSPSAPNIKAAPLTGFLMRFFHPVIVDAKKKNEGGGEGKGRFGLICSGTG